MTFNQSQVRGGRFEQLITRIMQIFVSDGIIDRVEWFGRLNEYGIPYPAPGSGGTSRGQPDILIHSGNTMIVLELTLIGDVRAQWSSEGVSVPEHVEGVIQQYPDNDVFGVFCAPIMHNPNIRNINDICEARDISINTMTAQELLDFINGNELTRESFLAFLRGD